MSLAGRGAVAIWHDIAPEGREDFYAWHGSEHMPERAAVPGFLRGRRYIAIEGASEFFNLYETTSTDVLSSRGYLDRLNAPTPWTQAAVLHFRDVARSLCEVAATHGHGEGGLVATFRYDVADDRANAHRAQAAAALEALARSPGIAGAHLLVADEAASTVMTAEKRARGGSTAVPRWIALVEGWGDEVPFVAAMHEFARGDVFADARDPADLAIYRLQNTCVGGR